MSETTISRGERTRQAILDAAYELMIEQGYAATSMRQIADHAGLALGGIYNHFSSKDDVFLAIVEERHPFLQIIPIMNSVKGKNVEDFVRKSAHTLVDELGRHPDFLNLLLIEIVEFKGEHVPKIFNKIFPVILPIGEKLASLNGEQRSIPPVVLVRAFLGMFFSYYITEILIGRALPPKMQVNALDYFVDIFLHGVLKESA